MNPASEMRSAERTRAGREFDAVVSAPFGAVGIDVEGPLVTGIHFLERAPRAQAPTSAVAQDAADRIERYLADPRMPIRVPLAPAGTEFQRKVWERIAAIPAGATRRHGEVADDVRSVARAVGQACGDNRYPLAIPCHRVVGAFGVGGFAHRRGGFLLDIKHWLLRHEALVLLDAR
jgi:methylated-DNA-[protein]-cysteine S-methyltransferase